MTGYIGARAEHGSFLFGFILIFLIVVAALVAIALYIIKTKKFVPTKEWIEKVKNQETKRKNVENLAKYAFLDSNEKKLLWEICKEHKPKNIEYSYLADKELNTLFSAKYQKLAKDEEENKEKIYILFSLRYKLERAKEKKLAIISTRSLHAGQKLMVLDSNKKPVNVEIESTDQYGMQIVVPQEMIENKTMPKALERTAISFITPQGLNYSCIVRITRYEKKLNDKIYMIIPHTNQLKTEQRRMAKRIEMRENITFSAVKEFVNINKKTYEIVNNRYKGLLLDISASGCKMVSGMPILENQMLQIFFEEGILEGRSARGIIVRTIKAKDDKSYILHIKFDEIAKDMQNKIYAYIYKY